MKQQGFAHLALVFVALILLSLGAIVLLPKNTTLQLVDNLLPQVTPIPTPIVTLTTQYENPFDRDSQYVNPFSTYKNPFNNVK